MPLGLLQVLIIEGLHPFFDDRVADLCDYKARSAACAVLLSVFCVGMFLMPTAPKG